MDDAHTTANLSLTAAIGGVVVMVITPLFGRLSDRTLSRLGKRRPWILGGAALGIVGTAVLAYAPSVWVVVLGWILTQAGFGAANAAVHALLADQIPARIRARVAAVASAAAGVFQIVGAVIVAALPNDQRWSWFLVPGLIGGFLCAALFFGLRDIVRTERPAPLELGRRGVDVLPQPGPVSRLLLGLDLSSAGDDRGWEQLHRVVHRRGSARRSGRSRRAAHPQGALTTVCITG